MIIYMSRFLLVLSAVMLTVSCGRNNIVSGVPVRYVTAERSVELKADSSFRYDFPQSLQMVSLYVQDSVLVVKENIGGNMDGRFFKCYSLEDGSCMGEYVLRGRGPGEALSPNIRGSFHDASGRECLYVFDISLGRSYGLDLAKSIEERKTEIFTLTDFPVQSLDAYLYRDTLQFVTITDNDRQQYRIMGLDGKEWKTFDILHDVSADDFLPQLSECIVLNQEEGLAAMLMLGLPQMNILNLNTGEVESYAVSPEFVHWRDIISRYDMNSIVYYNTAISSGEHIMALYIGESIADSVDMDCSHLHIYDWSGRFLYDITLSEVIDAISFDEKTEMLYALDRNANRIYRYDLSELI